MSSAKLNVSVYDGHRIVETLPARPIRLTPDGRAGVVYAGEVYPLYSDNSISLDAKPVKKSLCYSFVAPGADIPYAGKRSGSAGTPTIDRWYLESNRFGHYIVFDGNRDAASDLVTRLRRHQIAVIRWDESVRSADNGEMYDWFIRLDYDGTAEQCRHAVAPLMTPSASVSAPRQEPAVIAATRAATQAVEVMLLKLERDNAIARADSLELLADRASGLENEVAAATDRAKTLERQVARLQKKLTVEQAASSAELADLRGQVVAARAELDLSRPVATTSERIEQLMAAKTSAESDWLKAQEESDTFRSERDTLAIRERQLTEEVALRDQRIQQLAGEVTELATAERERRARRQGGSPQGGSYEDFLSRLLPRLALDPDDLDLLLLWPSPKEALQVLIEINAGGRPRHGKPVEGNKGWTEVAGINTGRKGSENMGRIYFRPVKSSEMVRVCLHDKQDKKEQSRFIERLPEV